MYTSIDRKKLKHIKIPLSEACKTSYRALHVFLEHEENKKTKTNVNILEDFQNYNIQNVLNSKTQPSDPRSPIVYQQKNKTRKDNTFNKRNKTQKKTETKTETNQKNKTEL